MGFWAGKFLLALEAERLSVTNVSQISTAFDLLGFLRVGASLQFYRVADSSVHERNIVKKCITLAMSLFTLAIAVIGGSSML